MEEREQRSNILWNTMVRPGGELILGYLSKVSCTTDMLQCLHVCVCASAHMYANILIIL